MTDEELAAYKEKTKHMAPTHDQLHFKDAASFDGANDFLAKKQLPINLAGEQHLVVFKTPLKKKQWKKLCKKYGLIFSMPLGVVK